MRLNQLLIIIFIFSSITKSHSQTKLELKEAGKHIGEFITVCHEVSHVFDTLIGTLYITEIILKDTTVKQTPSTILHPDPIAQGFVRIKIPSPLRQTLQIKPNEFLGKKVCVSGHLIVMMQLPTINLREEKDLVIKNDP